jgi:hypothetical protein
VPYKYRLVLHIQRVNLQYVLHYLTHVIRHFLPSQPSGTYKHHALPLQRLFLTFNHCVCALTFRVLANAIKANSTWFQNSQETHPQRSRIKSKGWETLSLKCSSTLATTLCALHGHPPEMSFINRLVVFSHHLKSSQLVGKKGALSIHHMLETLIPLSKSNLINPN